ncbi:hypothetical protein PoB_005427200 [Plakobranchus ocellatus]|uniref:Uncharacterized protein n=1 Tax=Plakobranchus ocellatus TaxID=259542 RepID=A0AAV4C910_9GAST|nr:hypothetical protein PoB_005427200 [Plakobranchus ocellatus]
MKFLQHHTAHSTMHGSYGSVEEQQEEEEQIVVELNMTEKEVGSQLTSAPSSPTPSVSSAASTTSAAPRAKKKKKTLTRAETTMGGRSGTVSEQQNCKRGP